MRVKIPPSEVIRQEIFGLLEREVLELLELLGRAYYQRRTSYVG